MGLGADRGLTQRTAADFLRNTWDFINKLGDEIMARVPRATAGSFASGVPTALNNTSANGNVVFPAGRFTVAPIVQLTQQAAAGSDTRTLHVTGVTTAGFSWTVIQNSGGLRSVTVNWTATEPT